MRILLALTVLALAVSPLSANQADEENAIREIQARWDDAWNRNDVAALSSLVAEDVRFVVLPGFAWVTGRMAIDSAPNRGGTSPCETRSCTGNCWASSRRGR